MGHVWTDTDLIAVLAPVIECLEESVFPERTLYNAEFSFHCFHAYLLVVSYLS